MLKFGIVSYSSVDMTDSQASVETLFLDLSHPNPNIRSEACLSLAENHSDIAMPHFFALLDDSDPVIYRTAVRGLGMLGHQVLPELLQLFLTSDNGTVRACCVKAIVQISVYHSGISFSDETINVLEGALDDQNPVVAQSALMTLGHLSKQESEKDRVIPLLIKACDSPNIAHVQAAAMALAELDSPLVIDSLQSLANDNLRDPLIREVAQASLARYESLNSL